MSGLQQYNYNKQMTEVNRTVRVECGYKLDNRRLVPDKEFVRVTEKINYVDNSYKPNSNYRKYK